MSSSPQNAFLLGLSPTSLKRLQTDLKSVEVRFGSYLQRNGEPVEWVYFPTSSLLSMISRGRDGRSVETALIGNEGAAGLFEACSSGVSSLDVAVQMDGTALRASARFCRELAISDPSFALSAWRMAELQINECRQSAFCLIAHSVQQRLSRWLLESVERSGGRNPLRMTQEFLGAMLGVQRTTVTTLATKLQRAGLIQYSRGHVRVIDHEALEATACDCRKASGRERARLSLQAICTVGAEAVAVV